MFRVMNGLRIIDSIFYLMASRNGIWNGLVLLENTRMNIGGLIRCGWMGVSVERRVMH